MNVRLICLILLKKKLNRILLLILLVITSGLFAQDKVNENDANEEINKLDSIFLVNFERLPKDSIVSIKNNFVEFLTTIESIRKTEINLKKDIILAQKDVLNSNKGFSLNAGYLDNQLSNVFDLEENINFKRRVLTTLQWNILNNGLIENQNRAKALDYQLQYEELKLQNQTDKDLYLQRFNQTIVVFNKEKIKLINARKNLMSELYEIEQELFLKKRINKDELLDVQLRKAEILC